MKGPCIWVTGAGGLIGSHLVNTAAEFAPGTKVLGLTRSRLDLADFAAVEREFRSRPPQLIIHCAALSRTEDCEANPPLARKLNLEVTAHLAGLAAGIPFTFFSTDLAFDGRGGHYTESAPVHPLTVYAETKVAAEQVVLANPKHTVIRTSLNAGTSPTRDRAFNERLRLAWHAGHAVRLFTDEFRCPIPAGCTARAVWELALKAPPGIYHVAGSERLSRWQVGSLIAARWPQLGPQIQAVSLKDYCGPPRAPDTSLNCAKAQKLLSFSLPRFSEWLVAHPSEEF